MDSKLRYRMRFGRVGAAGMISAAMVGCGAVPPSAAAIGTASSIEVYAVPAANPRLDGTLYLHDIGTSSTTDQLLNQGTDAISVPAVAPDGAAVAVMQWYSSSADRITVAGPGDSGQTWTSLGIPASDSSFPLTALEASGVRYIQVGNSVVASKTGTIVATYPLPVLKADDTAGTLPPGYKGVSEGTGVGNVSALVPASSGDILAFTFTGLAAAVTDLTTSQTTLLLGYSRLGAAARTAAGNIEVIAWKAQQENADIKVITLTGPNLAVGSTIDTGLAATNHLRDTVLPGLGHDAVIAIAHGDETLVDLQIWAIDGSTLTAEPALPPNSGLTIAPADAGSVYVYGGPARNSVSQLDMSTGALTRDLQSLRTQTGSFVVGIV